MRKAGLQKQLNIFKTFCDDKGLQVNPLKTFTMSFGMNTKKAGWIPFQYDGIVLQPRTEAKYLGMMFFTNKPFIAARKQLMNKARARMWALHRLMISRYVAATPAVQRVFVACVQAIFLYAVEIWGTGMPARQWKQAQTLQSNFYKLHLGLKSSTSPRPQELQFTYTLLAEVGDYPLEQAALVQTAGFYARIQGMANNRLPKQALQMVRQESYQI